jgi:hypothetical protein
VGIGYENIYVSGNPVSNGMFLNGYEMGNVKCAIDLTFH